MGVKFYRGTIVLVLNVPDQAGRNPKDRPVVLIRDFCEDDEFAFGVAITGEFDFPLPNTSIALSFNRDGKCKTGLRKESVAVCSWIVQVHPNDISHRMGFTPPIPLAAILAAVSS